MAHKFQQHNANERLCTKLGSTVISHGNLPFTLIYRNDSISQFYIYDLLIVMMNLHLWAGSISKRYTSSGDRNYLGNTGHVQYALN